MSASVPQPAKAVLALRRIPNKRIATEYGCSEQYVSRVLNGHVEPSEPFQQWLADYLEEPATDLFYRSAVASDVRDAARRLVARSCAQQDLAEQLTDPVTLRRIAALLDQLELVDARKGTGDAAA